MLQYHDIISYITSMIYNLTQKYYVLCFMIWDKKEYAKFLWFILILSPFYINGIYLKV